MDLLERLNRRFGKYGIPQLPLWLAAGQTLVFAVAWIAYSGIISLISLSIPMVLRGQVWRLVTFVFVPYSTDFLYFLIGTYLYFSLGSTLERSWGSGRFTIFYVVGMLGAIAGALLTGYGGNEGLLLSLLLAFTLLAPEATFLLFYLIPVKAKWLGWISLGLWAFRLIGAPWQVVVQNILSLSALYLFFGPQIISGAKARYRRWQWKRENKSYWDNNRR